VAPRVEDSRSRRFAAGLAELYGELMGIVPDRVETHLDGEILTAILFGSSAPAEDSLFLRPEGCRILRSYHEACARELFQPVASLARGLLGRRLVNLVLESAPPSRHKILVLVLARDPADEGPGGAGPGAAKGDSGS